jgi:hypothetical protein
MNIKELVEKLNIEALTFGMAEIYDHAMLDIKAELERLWRIEKCARSVCKYDDTEIVERRRAIENLEEALEAAKEQ